jgi:putative tryptophan/tyrosine transport system substrate-binding protein
LRELFAKILVCLLLSVGPAFAHEVLVVQSLRVKPFDVALSGFKSVCKADSKRFVVSEMEGANIVRAVREERPDLILAIGADALEQVKRIRDVPILYLMVLNPEKISGVGKNVSGVSMNIAPEKYLGEMEKLNLPNLRVGILYDPAKSGSEMRRILQTARAMGIELAAREVHNPKEVPEQLARMKGSFNVYWMLPDSTVVTPESVEFLLLFTQQNRIPVVTFASKYLEMGALFSLDIDSFDLGKQAGEMANKVFSRNDAVEFPKADARKALIRINRTVAKKLGISLDDVGTSSLPNTD